MFLLLCYITVWNNYGKNHTIQSVIIKQIKKTTTEYNSPLPFHSPYIIHFFVFFDKFCKARVENSQLILLYLNISILVRWYSVGKSWDQTSLSDYNTNIISLFITNPDWDIFGRVAFTASAIGQICSVLWHVIC